jgi:hypothetical protein
MTEFENNLSAMLTAYDDAKRNKKNKHIEDVFAQHLLSISDYVAKLESKCKACELFHSKGELKQ